MPRLPTPGGDAGNWGALLNEYLSVSHQNDGTLLPTATPNAATIAALKALVKPASSGTLVRVRGYRAEHDGGGGQFVWNSTSTDTADDALVVSAGGTGRWKRIVEGAVNVRWWGCVGDGVTDDAIPLSLALSTPNRSVLIPYGTYACGVPINIQGDRIVECQGTLKLTAPHAAGAFILVKADDSNILWKGGIIDCNFQSGMNGFAVGENIASTGGPSATNIRLDGVTVKNSRISTSQETGNGLYSGGGKGVTVQFHVKNAQLSNIVTDDCDVGLSIEGSDNGERYTRNVTVNGLTCVNSARAGLFIAGSRPSGVSSTDTWGYNETRYGMAVLRGIILDSPNTAAHADGGAIVCNYANFVDLEAIVISGNSSGIDLLKGNLTNSRVKIIASVDNLGDAIDVTPFTTATLAASTSASLDIDVDVRVKTAITGVLLRSDTSKTQRSVFSVRYHSPATPALSAGLNAFNHLQYKFYDVRQARGIESTSTVSTSPSFPVAGTIRRDLLGGILTLTPLATTPTINLVAGVIAMSDGTGGGFDALSGAGLYRYTGSVWKFIG